MKTLEKKNKKEYNTESVLVCRKKGAPRMTDHITVKGTLVDDKGTWVVRARVYSRSTNRYIQKSKSTGLKTSGNNRRKAEKLMSVYLEAWESDANSNIDLNRDPTLTEEIEEWLLTKKVEVRENTYAFYETIANAYVAPTLGNIKVRDLTRKTLQTYYTNLSKKLSSSTLKKIRVVINGTIKLAIEDNIIDKDVTTAIKLPKQEQYERKIITEDDIEKLLLAAESKGEPIYSAVILGVVYGLRRSEICGLRWKDIDFEKKLLTVTNTCTDYGGVKYELEKTKSPAGHRSIGLVGWTGDYFLALRNSRGLSEDSDKKVCVYSDGTPASPAAISRNITKLLNECGFEGVTLHGLRHTAGTILAHRLPIKSVQAFLGHQKASTTLDIYAHILDKDVADTSAVMSDVLSAKNISSRFCSEICSEK